ncbi:outer membrane protein transport protein [Legionella sp.]|uniref:OmpP1/FadL family transporter n=1 Tax=Legionella sp. TaxID=459 RepID=UPI00321FF0F1
MRIIFLAWVFIISQIINLTFFERKVYGAVDQILNSNFFQNPAELSQIKQIKLFGGNVFIMPKLKFTGTTSLGSGSAKSKVHDSLPYLLTAYRFTDRFVLGINITPSVYGHINWPINSIVAEKSTLTHFLYYRGSIQSSYQFTDKLALGAGFNLEYNKLGELDFVVPYMGNQINKVKGTNYTGDLGLFYKINSHNYLTMAIYTAVNTYGHGISSLGTTTVHNFSLNIVQAPVAFVGMQHWLSNKWLAEGKIYWSGWSIEKNINFRNKTTGNSISPANWRDTWSFQVNTRYDNTDWTALLGSIIYETNAAPISTNAIGYPLSKFGSLSVGIDLTLQKNFSTQLIYSFGSFISKSQINSGGSTGTVAANIQAAVIQFTYKV